MRLNRTPPEQVAAMRQGDLTGPDTDVSCSNPQCVGARLWRVQPRRVEGRIVGWEGQCAICGSRRQLPLKRHLVDTSGPCYSPAGVSP